MKILYVISTLQNSGPVNVIYGLCHQLSSKHEITVLTVGPEKNNSRLEDFVELGVHVDSLNLSSKQFLLSGRRHFREYLENNHFDIVHSHVLRPDWLAAGVSKRFPEVVFISTAHNNPKADYMDLFGKFFGNIISKLQYRLWNRLNIVIGCSEYVSDCVRQHVTRPQVATILNGTAPLPESQFSRIEQTRDKYELVYVGSMSHRKNVDFLVKTFSSQKHLWSKLSLTMIGTGDLFDELKSAYSSDQVQFMGFLQDPHEYLLSKSWVISASTAEGLPMSLIEGLECGCNLVMSDIAPHQELLAKDDNTKHSYLFSINQDNPDELSKLLTQINDDVISWNAGAHQLWEDNFSSQKMAEHYETTYTSLIQH